MRILAWRAEPMTRGHQERLAPLAQAVMAEAGLSFDSIERVGVTVGPGSFTGLRVGVAFAKGLASALGCATVGIGVLEALAADCEGLTFAAIDARRDQLYLQGFDGGRPLDAPQALSLEAAVALAAEAGRDRPLTLVGSGARLLAANVPHAVVREADWADPRTIARLAAARAPSPLKPLYLRAPDARLPGGKPGPHMEPA